MALFIPDNILDQILDRCDIAEIISSYIPLKRAGRSFKALCPFHHEKTPSFIVNPDKGIFHCFGCGAGGNVISFIMKYERLEFPEVVKMLAAKTGIALPEPAGRGQDESASLVNKLYLIHELAAAYFREALVSSSGKQAREYLENRGVLSDAVNKFKLGFAANVWDGLLNYLKRKGFDGGLIEKAGLIIPKAEGPGYYDRFRNRLIFPIFNQRDKVIAFAGRVLDDSLPKYMNSPETAIYNKSRTLYGLNFAKREIGDKDAAVIVEGYLDFLMPHQMGLQNIVASCGTALTQEHVRLLKRYSRNVVMVYDADKAGEMATLRGLDLLLAEDMHIGIARLPKGFDPDSYVRKNGIEAFRKLIEKPASLFEYKLSLLRSAHGVETAESRVKVADEMLKTIARINNAVLKSEYIKRLAESLALDESAVRQEAKKAKGEYEREYSADSNFLAKDEIKPLREADRIIIGLMLEDNNAISFVKEKIDSNEFSDKFSQRVVSRIFNFFDQNKPVTYSALISQLNIEGAENVLSEIAASHLASFNRQKNLEDCILWIKKDNFKRGLEELRNQIKEAQEAGEQDKVTELIARYNGLIKQNNIKGAKGAGVSSQFQANEEKT